jgi:hypothetical protein
MMSTKRIRVHKAGVMILLHYIYVCVCFLLRIMPCLSCLQVALHAVLEGQPLCRRRNVFFETWEVELVAALRSPTSLVREHLGEVDKLLVFGILLSTDY